MANAEVRGTFTKGGLTVRTRSWVAATENLAVTEMAADGGSVTVTAELFPHNIELHDNDKPVQLGREQHGNGRWYFDGLLDEIRIFDRALSPAEVRVLKELQEVTPGLLRRWKFEADEGTTPVDTAAKIVLGPACPKPPDVYRPNERPTDEPLGCRPDGYHLDYGRFGVGRRGRAVKLMHDFEYVDGGQVPAVRRVSVAAWISCLRLETPILSSARATGTKRTASRSTTDGCGSTSGTASSAPHGRCRLDAGSMSPELLMEAFCARTWTARR